MNSNHKLDNKYKSNNKINLYKDNLIKFIISQKEKIILIGNIEPIDYIVGILFLTESNRYFKQNKINSHGYYLAYTFINLFNKIRLRMVKSYKFNLNDISHYILSLSNNINYFNSRIDPTNSIKNKINNNFSKFQLEIVPILINLTEYNKIHQQIEINKIDIVKNSSILNNSSETSINLNLDLDIDLDIEINIDNVFNENINQEPIQIKNLNQKNSDINVNIDEIDKIEEINNCTKKELYKKLKKNYIKNENKCCDIECYSCWVTNILSKFFYLLLQTAKFLGSGSYLDPNLIRLSEYYANIFYTWFKSNDLIFLNLIDKNNFTEIYENYLNYKNKLNYSLIELDLGSETLDEILNYIDNEIIENLSIKLK